MGTYLATSARERYIFWLTGLALFLRSGSSQRPQEGAISAGCGLYYGSFTEPVNRDGVNCFIANVYPHLMKQLSNYRLVVAGRVGPEKRLVRLVFRTALSLGSIQLDQVY